MSEVYIEPTYHHHNTNYYHNTNYSMDIEADLNNERDKVLFYAIIIIFTVLFFLQMVFFSYYISKNCCKDTPYKRMKRKNSGMQVVLGKLEHNLDSEEQETLERLEEN
tara:strand:+ start:166 stop:489 length:324 start_codon:yes stop_codon:yes gene_type:complete